MEVSKSNVLEVNLDNYSGPLDVLLDLAKAQKVDLANISITQLADQFIEFINGLKNQNLDLASEFLLMATWLAYLKSKLLLPQDEDDDFKALEVAQKLKSQLRKLELIRLLSDQLYKKNRLGLEVRLRGMRGGIKLISKSTYAVSLYELLKSYANHTMKKNFLSINIPKLPVCSTEQAIDILKKNISKIKDWEEMTKLIPEKFRKTKRLQRTGIAGFFAASLELTKEGFINIMQKRSFDKILIKERK